MKHSKFKKNEAYYDVAVLKTEIKVEFSVFISPVFLPPSSSSGSSRSEEELNLSYSAVVIGWGSKSTLGKTSSFLKQAKLEVFRQR